MTQNDLSSNIDKKLNQFYPSLFKRITDLSVGLSTTNGIKQLNTLNDIVT